MGAGGAADPTSEAWRSCHVARDTRTFARDIGLLLKTTSPESPQSNGMAEAFVRTFKRDDAGVGECSDAKTVRRCDRQRCADLSERWIVERTAAGSAGNAGLHAISSGIAVSPPSSSAWQ